MRYQRIGMACNLFSCTPQLCIVDQRLPNREMWKAAFMIHIVR